MSSSLKIPQSSPASTSMNLLWLRKFLPSITSTWSPTLRTINLRPELLAELANLVREADALYRSHHYNHYNFLLVLSDVATGEIGLEHGQSSEEGLTEKVFSDEDHQLADADSLPHEFTHSWDGKYRRPVGLYQPDFVTPQQGAYSGFTKA